jgi:citrate lyase beta subunit
MLMPAAPDRPLLATSMAMSLADDLDRRLAQADDALADRFPGARPGRQPVHTVYVPANQYESGLQARWADEATTTLDRHENLFRALTDDQAGELMQGVRAKLATEPIEDLRIDFEDGYGSHGDDVEDADALAAADALAVAQREGVAPPFSGIRFKSFESPTRRRGVRTLAVFVHQLLESGGVLDDFVVTLPKVTGVEQVEAMVYVCEQLEQTLALTEPALRFEIQVETPQSIIGPDGTALVARMLHASDGRCTALHYGTYDYSAFCGIAAEYQAMDHPAADFAKFVMQAAAAGTGVRLSDGSTNIIPVGDESVVRHAWTEHLRLVRRSLRMGYYQGWDLHPAQLPTRYAATYDFYRSGFPQAASRLRRYVGRSQSAILDEPATARALADYIVRGVDCGAMTSVEAGVASGLSIDELTAMARPAR